MLLDSRATHKEVQFGRQIFRSAIWTAMAEEIVELRDQEVTFLLCYCCSATSSSCLSSSSWLQLALQLFKASHTHSSPRKLCHTSHLETIPTMLATAKDGWLMSVWPLIYTDVQKFSNFSNTNAFLRRKTTFLKIQWHKSNLYFSLKHNNSNFWYGLQNCDNLNFPALCQSLL